ncbi:MAG: hypothetical protein K8J31_10690 [Anaerolineae bacterium]|nr:hypothetical protein [Anaerolineae bacterium]
MTFNSLFHPTDPDRSRFLNGLFNLFARDVIRCWTTDPQCAYTNLGKPTLRQTGAARGSPLDFAFQERRKQQVFAVVMLSDPLDNTPLKDPAQIEAFRSTRTFAAFLEAAQKPADFTLGIGSSEYPAAGSILIWSSFESKKTRAVIRKTYAFQDVLSLEDIVRDLIQWQNRDFQMLLDRRAAWCYDFFRSIRQLK